MTMRTNFMLKAFLAMLTALLGAGVFAIGAFANTGGVAVAGSPAGPKPVHKNAIATWFGPGFYGKKTACGQVMTPEIVGVANRTLPCGTLVKVSYHGLRVTLPVIDRGPYSHIGADWDLTTGAARTLGIEDTVRIATRIVGVAPNTPTLGLAAGPPASAATGGAIAG
jgi:rare lipoprotein A